MSSQPQSLSSKILSGLAFITVATTISVSATYLYRRLTAPAVSVKANGGLKFTQYGRTAASAPTPTAPKSEPSSLSDFHPAKQNASEQRLKWLIVSHGTSSPAGVIPDVLPHEIVFARLDEAPTNLPVFPPATAADAPLAASVRAAADASPAGLGSITDYTGVIILGGTMGVYERAKYPFIEYELAFIRALLAANVPTLGICLGSQLIAEAAGGRVFASARPPEVGAITLRSALPLSRAGAKLLAKMKRKVPAVAAVAAVTPPITAATATGAPAALGPAPAARALERLYARLMRRLTHHVPAGKPEASDGLFYSHHGDTFVLPPGARLLAVTGTLNLSYVTARPRLADVSSDDVSPTSALPVASAEPGSCPGAALHAYPQAFALGSALGLQFHPEATLGQLRIWCSSDVARGPENKYVRAVQLRRAEGEPEHATGAALMRTVSLCERLYDPWVMRSMQRFWISWISAVTEQRLPEAEDSDGEIPDAQDGDSDAAADDDDSSSEGEGSNSDSD